VRVSRRRTWCCAGYELDVLKVVASQFHLVKSQHTGNRSRSPVRDCHDFNATILHTLGIDHMKLTFQYQGRHFRLTDVFGNVVKAALA